jgi:hypothetical protein
MWTFLGKEAWRTTDKRLAERMIKMLSEGVEDAVNLPFLCDPIAPKLLDLEDWTW